jgi:hypothetical protein
VPDSKGDIEGNALIEDDFVEDGDEDIVKHDEDVADIVTVDVVVGRSDGFTVGPELIEGRLEKEEDEVGESVAVTEIETVFVVIAVNEKLPDEDIVTKVVREKVDFVDGVFEDFFDTTPDKVEIIVSDLIEVREIVTLDVIAVDSLGETDGEPLFDGEPDKRAEVVRSLDCEEVGKELAEEEVEDVSDEKGEKLTRTVAVIKDVAD